jgi:hypothetical protein
LDLRNSSINRDSYCWGLANLLVREKNSGQEIMLGWTLSLFLPEVFYCLRLLAAIKRVMQRQTRTAQEQPGTRIPHDLLRFLPHLRLITVHQTFAASRFLFLKRALVQSQKSIRQKLGAFKTQLSPFSLMVTFAVNVNHHVNSFFLSRNTRMLLAQLYRPFSKEYAKQKDKV